MVGHKTKTKRKKVFFSCAITLAIFALVIFVFVALLEWTDIIRCHHTWAHRGYVAPTCVTQGFSDEQYCTKCGEVFKNRRGKPTPYAKVEDCTACDSHEFRFEVDSETNTGIITGFGPDFSGDKVVIPAEYKGFKVIGIGNGAFNYCDEIKSVEIADTVLEIGNSAFAYCYELESVTFGENSALKVIGSQSFKNCGSLQSIDVPDGVKEIGEQTFANCVSMASVNFGDSSLLEVINSSAFSGCRNLISFTVPAKVIKIGREVFYGCKNLQKVVFENPTGWVIKSPVSTNNTPIDVGNPEDNAVNFLSIYQDDILIREEDL